MGISDDFEQYEHEREIRETEYENDDFGQPTSRNVLSHDEAMWLLTTADQVANRATHPDVGLPAARIATVLRTEWRMVSNGFRVGPGLREDLRELTEGANRRFTGLSPTDRDQLYSLASAFGVHTTNHPLGDRIAQRGMDEAFRVAGKLQRWWQS